jgi:hypothetical protein
VEDAVNLHRVHIMTTVYRAVCLCDVSRG